MPNLLPRLKHAPLYLTTPPGMYYLFLVLIIPLSSLGTIYGLRSYYLSHPEKTPPAIVDSLLSQNSPISDSSNLTPSPTPFVYPILKGKEVYKVNQGSKDGPRILEATIDPLDPDKNQTQTFNLRAQHTADITRVEVTRHSDNDSQTQILKLTDGPAQDGTWSGSFKSSDTHLHKYIFSIQVQAGDQTSSIDITIR